MPSLLVQTRPKIHRMGGQVRCTSAYSEAVAAAAAAVATRSTAGLSEAEVAAVGSAAVRTMSRFRTASGNTDGAADFMSR